MNWNYKVLFFMLLTLMLIISVVFMIAKVYFWVDQLNVNDEKHDAFMIVVDKTMKEVPGLDKLYMKNYDLIVLGRSPAPTPVPTPEPKKEKPKPSKKK